MTDTMVESDSVPIMEQDSLNEEDSSNKNVHSSLIDKELLEIEGIGGSLCCHPQRTLHKLIALFLMCMLGFGSYYCYDNPGALQDQIKKAIPVTTFQFASLYSWYAWPNVILPIIGGYLIDTVFGIRFGANFFAGFILLGQIIFSVGGFYDSLTIMQVGRFVFGIGGESLAVAQNTYAAAWFSGDALNMVFGFQLSTARLGSSVNYWTVGPLFDWLKPKFPHPYTVLGWTLLITSSTCVLSLVSSIILGIIDKRAARLLKKDEIHQEKITLRDIVTFRPNFWLLSIVCVAYYNAVFPFISLGQVFFIKKYNYHEHEANTITGLVYLISAFASPCLGFIIDRSGRNLSFVLVAVLLTLLSHALLAFTYLNPYVPIVLMGIAYSLLASALWPICTLIVPKHQLGTAFGLMQAIQNLGLAVIPLGAGVIVDKYGYLWLEIFFIFWLFLAFLTTVLMGINDMKNNDSYLNMSAENRKKYKEAKLKETKDEIAQ